MSAARDRVAPGRYFGKVLLTVVAAVVLATTLLALIRPSAADAAATLPAGFQEDIVLSGLKLPTAVDFSNDGRIFVAEKSGLIKVFDDLYDTTPTTFADLRTSVHNYQDRGLLGLALDPEFPSDPHVYVFYAHDAAIGGTAPRWNDTCPQPPPGETADGCVIGERLSRLQANGNVMTGTEQVLIEDWCQQYGVHAGGGLAFGSDGALYVGGGEGASAGFLDYGQDGDPLNPCGDPPAGVGGVQTSPTAEGGSLRSQDLRTSGDPAGLSGSIIRVDPDTGAALPDNPLSSSADLNARRIVAYGIRTAFRLTTRPGTNEVWVGDVGGGKWEEINRIANPTGPVKNFGWPCYEGGPRHAAWDALDLNICENLYGETSAVTSPFFAYHHNNQVVEGESCTLTNGSATTGLAFYEGGNYPAKYDGSLFFADNSRDCIWVMNKGSDGLPDPANRETFVEGTPSVVDLEIGPGGNLFYVNLAGGDIRRIGYSDTNRSPTAVASATPTSGPAPLEVTFDGTGSSDPDPDDTLAYAWDLDGDGAYDDSTSPQPTYTYNDSGSYTARLRVTDEQGASDTDSLVINVDNTPPVASIDAPLPSATWRANDIVRFSGSATDEEDGSLSASSLTWDLVLHHCPSDCHQHPLQEFSGVASGEFVAPDHEYPSYLELRLTATDSSGLVDTESLRLDPETVQITYQSEPTGLQLIANSESVATPFSRNVIVGSKNSISAPSPQTLGGTGYEFASWSDGGARNHDFVAGDSPATYSARYEPVSVVSEGLAARYYDDKYLSDLKLTRTDPAVHFTWGTGSPDPSIAPDDFSVRWEGQVKADHSETYTFYTTANDGVRLWIDGQVIVNRWGAGSKTDAGTISLDAGWHDIKIEYFEGVKTANAKLEYSSATTTRQVVPTSNLRSAGATDTTAPILTATVPEDGATGVAADTSVSATFSEPMDPSTLTGSTFTLTEQGSATEVAATVTYSASTNKATLVPSAGLVPSTTYVARVTTGVTDEAGNPLSNAKSWSFTTAAPPPDPSTYNLVVSTQPDRSNPSSLDNATVSGKIYVFSSPDQGVSKVEFWLDDPDMSGAPRRVEKGAPYDFAGGTVTTAYPFNTANTSNGSHTITAKIYLSDNATEVVSSTFNVDNST